MRGAGMTIEWVMPVRIVISGGIAQPGFTSVWNVPKHSPPRSLTAPISVIAQDSAEPPVVSRSMMQKVTWERGVPRSSRESCMESMAGDRTASV